VIVICVSDAGTLALSSVAIRSALILPGTHFWLWTPWAVLPLCRLAIRPFVLMNFDLS
jgi:hypothetical protein